MLGADEMVPAEYRAVAASPTTSRPGITWADVVEGMREDEFYLDPTRMTLVCGTAGFDGTQFKGLLASEYNIQLNKTSRNSRAAAVEHQQHPQRRRPADPRAGRDLRRRSRSGWQTAARTGARLSRRG